MTQTTPLDQIDRAFTYTDQNRRKGLTPRQWRRIIHKLNRSLRRNR